MLRIQVKVAVAGSHINKFLAEYTLGVAPESLHFFRLGDPELNRLIYDWNPGDGGKP